MKDLELIDTFNLKREMFDLFDIARILFNDYYNGKKNYTIQDIKNIYVLIAKIQLNINNIKNEIE